MDFSELKSVCGGCTIRELCLPAGLTDQEVLLLDQHMSHRQPVKKGESLYRTGDAFKSLYAVSAGFFKTSILHEDGRTQVTGFQMAGEILGLDAISTDQHVCDAVALEDSVVCEVPFDRFEELGQLMNNLQRRFNRTLSREIVRDQGVMLLLGSMRSEERLAAFLVNLTHRFSARKQSSSELVLRMTREDIGSYLGLKLETVSRLLSRFHDEGLLSVRGRNIQILNPEGLNRLVGTA
ncbi:MAG: fumarate/nitrate reduction transcriptional regulator Fnr [Betaproteobacteria bacterium]|nr:fumarate/nitrate reduction transcriptional regulator Fnr [Betaproteobacteria bacterium]MDE2623440.1 fumarate/nitrate reduction transcriptional regulator Fnr [Betaproteobacteria bacterium]